jgi:hypothetical protein
MRRHLLLLPKYTSICTFIDLITSMVWRLHLMNVKTNPFSMVRLRKKFTLSSQMDS